MEERLTLVEASVRVLPAVDPAQGSVLLMGLLSPLMHVLAQGLQSTSPDEAAVRLRTTECWRERVVWVSHRSRREERGMCKW